MEDGGKGEIRLRELFCDDHKNLKAKDTLKLMGYQNRKYVKAV